MFAEIITARLKLKREEQEARKRAEEAEKAKRELECAPDRAEGSSQAEEPGGEEVSGLEGDHILLLFLQSLYLSIFLSRSCSELSSLSFTPFSHEAN